MKRFEGVLLVFGTLLGASALLAPALLRAGDVAQHPVVIEHPPTLGVVDTPLRDASGGVIGVACATCHASGSASALAEREGVPSDFHGTVELRHGELACASCHAPDDRTKLRLADGQTLAMTEVVSLCGQCHGTQYRSFRHGAHGGARGYWDLSRGPRVRNSCVACHAAHQPAYPLVSPAPAPNDRFLAPPASHPATGHAGQAHGDRTKESAQHD